MSALLSDSFRISSLRKVIRMFSYVIFSRLNVETLQLNLLKAALKEICSFMQTLLHDSNRPESCNCLSWPVVSRCIENCLSLYYAAPRLKCDTKIAKRERNKIPVPTQASTYTSQTWRLLFCSGVAMISNRG